MTNRRVACGVIGLALALAACGSSGAESDVGETSAGSGDEAPGALAEDEAIEEADADAPPDDGMRCLPVATCASFANQRCALVDPDGRALGEDGEPVRGARVREACPDGRGVDSSVEACFEYVESEARCRRPPDIRSPEWPCARTADGGCDVQML